MSSLPDLSVGDVPSIVLHVPVGRDYGFLLLQTKTVYDGLLEDKHHKLMEELLEKRQVMEIRVKTMAKKHPQEAVEFAAKCNSELDTMQDAAMREVRELHADYQTKLGSMQQTLEMKWREEHAMPSSPT